MLDGDFCVESLESEQYSLPQNITDDGSILLDKVDADNVFGKARIKIVVHDGERYVKCVKKTNDSENHNLILRGEVYEPEGNGEGTYEGNDGEVVGNLVESSEYELKECEEEYQEYEVQDSDSVSNWFQTKDYENEDLFDLKDDGKNEMPDSELNYPDVAYTNVSSLFERRKSDTNDQQIHSSEENMQACSRSPNHDEDNDDCVITGVTGPSQARPVENDADCFITGMTIPVKPDQAGPQSDTAYQDHPLVSAKNYSGIALVSARRHGSSTAKEVAHNAPWVKKREKRKSALPTTFSKKSEQRIRSKEGTTAGCRETVLFSGNTIPEVENSSANAVAAPTQQSFTLGSAPNYEHSETQNTRSKTQDPSLNLPPTTARGSSGGNAVSVGVAPNQGTESTGTTAVTEYQMFQSQQVRTQRVSGESFAVAPTQNFPGGQEGSVPATASTIPDEFYQGRNVPVPEVNFSSGPMMPFPGYNCSMPPPPLYPNPGPCFSGSLFPPGPWPPLPPPAPPLGLFRNPGHPPPLYGGSRHWNRRERYPRNNRYEERYRPKFQHQRQTRWDQPNRSFTRNFDSSPRRRTRTEVNDSSPRRRTRTEVNSRQSVPKPATADRKDRSVSNEKIDAARRDVQKNTRQIVQDDTRLVTVAENIPKTRVVVKKVPHPVQVGEQEEDAVLLSDPEDDGGEL